MKKSRYSDEPIVRDLRRADSVLIAEVGKRYERATRLYTHGISVSGDGQRRHVKRLKALEAENSRLKNW